MTHILEVAVPCPLRKTFDYLLPEDLAIPVPGTRVQVPWGKSKQLIAILLAVKNKSHYKKEKLKPIIKILDSQPLYSAELFKLLKFASDYYLFPIGEVYHSALPKLLRSGNPLPPSTLTTVEVTVAGIQQLQSQTWCKKAKAQASLLKAIEEYTRLQPLSIEALKTLPSYKSPLLKKLIEGVWIQHKETTLKTFQPQPTNTTSISLNAEQKAAVSAIRESSEQFSSFLLEGITGSGKTEVYLQIIESTIAKQRQALVLVPEISLTPQMIHRFNARFQNSVHVLHSNLSDKQRVTTWNLARLGQAAIVIGTRSALFTPFANLGIIIVDEEHDMSFKQQEGFRYSARDLSLVRAQYEDIPIVLGSATPSLETLHNAYKQRHQLLKLSLRAGAATPPTLKVVDLNQLKQANGLAFESLKLIRQHLDQGHQALLFLNRRGFAPSVFCSSCHWVACCKLCDKPYTFHRQINLLLCHHCDTQQHVPSQCPMCHKQTLMPLGAGTERLESYLKEKFANTPIIRIDRDTTRKKGELDSLLQQVSNDKAQLLIGTQMLAKGHHFPNVTLVVIIDADSGILSADLFALERFGQLLTQVAGRAGRGENKGTVLIQTRFPDYPALTTLLTEGYPAFSQELLENRRLTRLPPFEYLALLRAESQSAELAIEFLQTIKSSTMNQQDKPPYDKCKLLGPVPSPMQKRQGRHRAQLLLTSSERNSLHAVANFAVRAIESSPLKHKVRWSIDVDPKELF